MKALRFLAAIATALVVNSVAHAAEPLDFLYTGNGDLERNVAILERPDIAGVQVVYNWRALEKAEGSYDFSAIERDLAVAESLGKKFVLQVQDRFFSEDARNLPDYVLTEEKYGGGLVPQLDNPGESKAKAYGWASMQWNAALRGRYQALLTALADKFDGRIFALNLPETSIDIDMEGDKTGFSCDAYFDAEIENLTVARAAFKQAHVVQYVNFWPCEWNNDREYMSRLFALAAEKGIGLGGPDIIPNRRAQMANAYPFFNQYKGQLSYVGMAVQEPTLTYKNEATGKPFTREEFTAYARDFLGVNAIFWSASSPWLKQ